MTTSVVTWYNNKAYKHDIIQERIDFVSKNMKGVLPLYGKEKELLLEYAKQNHIPDYEMISLRNSIRVSREIKWSRYFDQAKEKIQSDFKELVSALKKDSRDSSSAIRLFLRKTKMPVILVLDLIGSMPEFKELNETSINYFDRIRVSIIKNNKEISYRSMQFEQMLERYIKNNITDDFFTELEIRKQKLYPKTPDILFKTPIFIELDGIKHQINWLDAKNFTLIDIPFHTKSIIKQTNGYNEIFGPGAFVFHYGFDVSISIPDALFLDGSFMDHLEPALESQIIEQIGIMMNETS